MLARICENDAPSYPPRYFCARGYDVGDCMLIELVSTFLEESPVEMMDMQAAERWFDQSAELMVAMRKNSVSNS